MGTPLLAGGEVADLLQSTEFFWLVGALVGVMLLGAIVLSWIERWRRRQLADNPASDIVQINTYRAMFERGELTQEEYDRIKTKEAQRYRNKLVAKPAKPARGEPAPPAQPAPPEPGQTLPPTE